jgi:hypothetical protein
MTGCYKPLIAVLTLAALRDLSVGEKFAQVGETAHATFRQIHNQKLCDWQPILAIKSKNW